MIPGCETSVQTLKKVRLFAYSIEDTDYWIGTNRFDLTADQIAEAYRLRWEIIFFFMVETAFISLSHISKK